MSLRASKARPRSTKDHSGLQRRTFWGAYVAILVLGYLFARLMRVFPPSFGVAALVLLVVVGVAVIRPDVGLGMAVALLVVGDAVAMAWWPFAKNFSSSESVLFIADGISINPFEVVLVAVLVVWFVNRRLATDAPPVQYGPFWRPLSLFSVMLVFGLAWGLGRGGDVTVALWEVRPLVYVPLVYLAAVNLFTTFRHYYRAFWAILIASMIETIHTIVRLPAIRSEIAEDASPLQHTAALHMNLLFIFLIASVWFGTERAGKRLLLLLMTAPMLLLYLDAERRAGVVALIIGGCFLAFVLFARDRRKFYRIIPVMALIGIVYVGAFWNVENGAGFPAQAVKIIVQPDSAAVDDENSDVYREIENFDLNATIRDNPVTGIGFGQPFDQPIPLPDISFFAFADYIPHNSVLWVWTKVGIVGFLTFLYVFGMGVAEGVRVTRLISSPDDAAMVATVAAYVPMTFIVAFVDITFDIQTMVLLSIALALVASAERLVEPTPGDPAAPAGA